SLVAGWRNGISELRKSILNTRAQAAGRQASPGPRCSNKAVSAAKNKQSIISRRVPGVGKMMRAAPRAANKMPN
ncbi:hypothetical protein ACCS78_17690, partial [Rhizobium johnstonii]